MPLEGGLEPAARPGVFSALEGRQVFGRAGTRTPSVLNPALYQGDRGEGQVSQATPDRVAEFGDSADGQLQRVAMRSIPDLAKYS